VLILWYVDELIKDQKVIGQVNIPLREFQSPGAMPGYQQQPVPPQQSSATTDPSLAPFMNIFKGDIVDANALVGRIDLKMQYYRESTVNNLEMFRNDKVGEGVHLSAGIPTEEAKQPAD